MRSTIGTWYMVTLVVLPMGNINVSFSSSNKILRFDELGFGLTRKTRLGFKLPNPMYGMKNRLSVLRLSFGKEYPTTTTSRVLLPNDSMYLCVNLVDQCSSHAKE